MNVSSGVTLKFDKFWSWLKEHANCIVRAGTPELWLFDQDELHWHLEEDGSRNPVVQIISGKRLLSELVLDVRDVAFVQATPDRSAGERGTLFELVATSAGETFVAYHFLMSHALDEDVPAHASTLKH